MECCCWTTASALLLVLLASILYLRPKHFNLTNRSSNIPFLGSLFLVMQQQYRLPSFLYETTKSFGTKTWLIPFPKIGLLSGGAIVLADHNAVNHILVKNFKNYEKGSNFTDAFEELLGDGIFVKDGATWTFHRKVASRMFTRRLMQNTSKLMEQYVDKMIIRLGTAAKNQTLTDLQDLYFRLTIDVFTKVAFDVDLQSFAREEQHEFAKSFDRIQFCLDKRFFNPSWPILRFFGLGYEAEIPKLAKILNDFAETVIEKRREEDVDELGPDLISRFLKDAADRHETVDVKELRDITMNFLIAGRDTTACAMSWTTFELVRNPQVLDALLQELSGVDIRTLELDKLVNSSCLPYLHAVVLEALRLHPSVPKQAKYAIDKDVLPDGTKVPGGAPVVYSAYQLNRSPLLFSDPEQFRPSRWLLPNENAKTEAEIAMAAVPTKEMSPTEYITFNAGPRICLGKGLALMEIKLVLAKVLPLFSFTESAKHSGDYVSTIVMPMKGGFPVTVTERTV